MRNNYAIHWPQFYTATVYEWRNLLAHDNCKDIIISSLKFLVDEKRVNLYGFVIMSNHVHLIWHPLAEHKPSEIQASFMRHTAKQLKRTLINSNNDELEKFKVSKYDRSYQIWKREPLSIELFTPEVLIQKLEYIYSNPVKAGLCKHPEEYQYSSARFYFEGNDQFDMLTHYSGN